jgi:hypothetical protein
MHRSCQSDWPPIEQWPVASVGRGLALASVMRPTKSDMGFRFSVGAALDLTTEHNE